MTPDFVEKLVLLLATVLLTGIGAPWILKRIDERRSREQRILEAAIARQGKLIDSQAALLDNLARLLWRYQLTAIEVTYYHDRKDKALYTRAQAKYEETAGDLLGQIRAEISRSLHLTSRETYEQMKSLYYDVLLSLDQQLSGLVEGRSNEWVKFNKYLVYGVADQVDDTLNKLATELKLKAEAPPGQTKSP